MIELEKNIDEIFKKLYWIRIKKVKYLFYKGKASILIKFMETHEAIIAHFSLTESFSFKRKLLFGQNT